MEYGPFRTKKPVNFGIGGEVWPDPSKPVIYRNIQIHIMR
jgi:hypothetical protein